MDKAIEYGLDILINNKADEYLQATVWDMIFWKNTEKAISVIKEREEKLSPTLLADIIRFTTIEKTKLDEREIRIICEAYESYDNEVQKSMFCKYDDFKKFYLG